MKKTTRILLKGPSIFPLSEAITKRILKSDQWLCASSVALFVGVDALREIDTKPLISAAEKEGKEVFLPCYEERMRMIRIRPTTRWERSRHNIPQPVATEKDLQTAPVDLALVPGVGFDLKGGRLGRGGGFYDRWARDFGAKTLIGVCADAQLIEQVPMDSWDVRMHGIVTESRFEVF